MYRMVLKHDVGALAPGFTLKDPDGRDVSLESFREQGNVVLVFFIGGFDRDAVRNLRALADRYPEIREAGAGVVAITPELPGKVKTLAESLKPPYPMLSDPDLTVVKEYDIYNPDTNWAWPAAFILDRDGVIQYAFRGASNPNTPPVEYLLLVLARMKEGKPAAAPGRART
ncbi:MAG: thiol-disulfide oxidoreductase [Methanocella sp. PtaU1.Bin125]|nr:MAG: thiol-disulfide oxidoreductase [Methanocella sp. PtaU1.Bin125]